MTKDKRSNAGSISVDKVAVLALAVCGSLLTYIYISNQSEDRGYMKSIAHDVSKISSMTVVIEQHLKNTDAMVAINGGNIEKNEVKLELFHTQSQAYWRRRQ